MELGEVIKKRKSVRRFGDKKVNWRKILRALDTARFAPAAGNQVCLKFILVKNREVIDKLADASQQSFVRSAKYVVVFVSDDSKLVRSYDERGKKYARQQAGAAIQNFLLSLEEFGLATCWIGAFVDEQVKRVLGIPEDDNFVVEGFFPIGKETDSKIKGKPKDKTELDNLLYFDKWKNKNMTSNVLPST